MTPPSDRRSRPTPATRPPLSEEGGKSYSRSDDSERLARIETANEFMREDLRELRVDVRDVRERVIRLDERMIRLEWTVSTLPTKGWALATLSSMLLFMFGLMTALVAFQGQIQTYLGTN